MAVAKEGVSGSGGAAAGIVVAWGAPMGSAAQRQHQRKPSARSAEDLPSSLRPASSWIHLAYVLSRAKQCSHSFSRCSVF